MPTKGTAYYNGPDRKKDLEAYALRAPYPGEWLPSPSFLSGRDGDRTGGRTGCHFDNFIRSRGLMGAALLLLAVNYTVHLCVDKVFLFRPGFAHLRKLRTVRLHCPLLYFTC